MRKIPNEPIRAVWRWMRFLVLRPFVLEAENKRLRNALSEIAKRGANPITGYGYGTEKPWVRLADDVWEISRNALSENVKEQATGDE